MAVAVASKFTVKEPLTDASTNEASCCFTVEVVGYAARVVSARNPTEKNPYVIQFCLVILAPVLMAGVIYVLFSRIVFWVVPPESRSISLLWVPRKCHALPLIT